MLVMVSMVSFYDLQVHRQAYMGVVRVSRMIWVLCILSILLTYLSLGFFVGHIVRKQFCGLIILDIDPSVQQMFVLLLNWGLAKVQVHDLLRDDRRRGTLPAG